jgi:hypothetical protein
MPWREMPWSEHVAPYLVIREALPSEATSAKLASSFAFMLHEPS